MSTPRAFETFWMRHMQQRPNQGMQRTQLLVMLHIPPESIPAQRCMPRAQVDRLSAITPEKDALRSHIVGATHTSQTLVRFYTRLEAGLFFFEVANIMVFGALFLAIVFTKAGNRSDAPQNLPAAAGQR